MERRFKCTDCGYTTVATTTEMCCPQCGGLWQLLYEAPRFDLQLVQKDLWNIFRYQAFLPLLPFAAAAYSLGEGMTPVIRYKKHILFKMDYQMPTLSFKDRGAAVLIEHCRQSGVKQVVQDSSGNAGNSIAAYCGRAKIACEIFVPEGTAEQKIKMIRAHGASCTIVHGSRDHCAEVCRKKAKQEKIFYANHVYNPFFYQGTKTYIYEVYEQLQQIPAAIVLPLGNGTLFIGAVLALEELLQAGLLEKMPQLIAVQSERCAPFAAALKKKAAKVEFVQAQPTLAEGIAIGAPMRAAEILSLLRRYAVKVIAVPEQMILPARMELAQQGIFCEPTTAANYAAYELYCQQYGTPAECLIPMCGAGLKSSH